MTTPGCVLEMLRKIAQANPNALDFIEGYIDSTFPGDSRYVSAKPAERKITFAPHVFSVPDTDVEPDLVSVMMPFSPAFDLVYDAIRKASSASGLRSLRADDIWEESTIMQDVFKLIFRSQVVVVDFTAKNPNVMYETGIAHTLGKHVVPISQSLQDVPFDLGHHRVLTFLANTQGLAKLSDDLTAKLAQLGGASR